jgi:His/Glu/Gln/Arg/opine family amino acid ABC transporter permease subunit
MDYHFTLRTIYPYLGELPLAIGNTLLLSALAIVISMSLGAFGAMARVSKSRLIRFLIASYVEILRNVPLLVVLYIVYFAAPTIGLRMSSFSSALLALTLNSAAYMTEILRAGLIAVHKGQFEAASAQGFSSWQMYRHVILPQVFKTAYAPLGNQFINVVLGSALASVVAFNDVTAWMLNTGSSSYRFFESFAVAAIIYVVLCQLINVARIVMGRILFKETRR